MSSQKTYCDCYMLQFSEATEHDLNNREISHNIRPFVVFRERHPVLLLFSMENITNTIYIALETDSQMPYESLGYRTIE